MVHHVVIAEFLGGGCVRSGRRNHHGIPVVAELGNGLSDVSQRAVVARLFRGVEVGARVPALGQLLDGRDINRQ